MKRGANNRRANESSFDFNLSEVGRQRQLLRTYLTWSDLSFLSLTCFLYWCTRAKEGRPCCMTLAGMGDERVGSGGSGEMLLYIDFLCRQSKINRRMRLQCERKTGVKDDSNLFGLSSWKYGVAINKDRQTVGRTEYGRKIRGLVWNMLNLSCPLSTQVMIWNHWLDRGVWGLEGKSAAWDSFCGSSEYRMFSEWGHLALGFSTLASCIF